MTNKTNKKMRVPRQNPAAPLFQAWCIMPKCAFSLPCLVALEWEGFDVAGPRPFGPAELYGADFPQHKVKAYTLAGNVFEFVGDEADMIKTWFDTVTGTAEEPRIVPPR
jgi:hypothetical protein